MELPLADTSDATLALLPPLPTPLAMPMVDVPNSNDNPLSDMHDEYVSPRDVSERSEKSGLDTLSDAALSLAPDGDSETKEGKKHKETKKSEDSSTTTSRRDKARDKVLKYLDHAV